MSCVLTYILSFSSFNEFVRWIKDAFLDAFVDAFVDMFVDAFVDEFLDAFLDAFIFALLSKNSWNMKLNINL